MKKWISILMILPLLAAMPVLAEEADAPGLWYLDLGGAAVELNLMEDGTYTLTAPGADRQSGEWTMNDGFLYMDGASAPALAIWGDKALMTSDESAFFFREKPYVYTPGGLVENTPAELYAGYWKAAYADVGGTAVPVGLLDDVTDLYVEGVYAILGGPVLGDTQVKLGYESGTLACENEGVKVQIRFQADGYLRLTVTGSDTAPQTWYMIRTYSEALDME